MADRKDKQERHEALRVLKKATDYSTWIFEMGLHLEECDPQQMVMPDLHEELEEDEEPDQLEPMKDVTHVTRCGLITKSECAVWFANQIFWLVITLVVIYFILSRIALPRIAAVLADRSGTITNDIAAAEELKQKAAEAEAAYEQALKDARAEAGRIAAEAKAEVQAEVDVALQKADAEIAARTSESEAKINEIRDGAAVAVRDVAKDTAKAVAAALGVDADGAALDAAVRTLPSGGAARVTLFTDGLSTGDPLGEGGTGAAGTSVVVWTGTSRPR